MNLKSLQKIKVVERTLSMVQDNLVTWANSIIVAFSNLVPGKVVITDENNDLDSSDVSITELDSLIGIESNVQEQIDVLDAEIATKLTSPTWTTFTPTVTLVGGAGNTTPVYTTNSGRYITVGKIVFVDVLLTGDGGAEGAGTGVINIALPLAASSNSLDNRFPIGSALNSASEYLIFGQIPASSSTIALAYLNTTTAIDSFQGSFQNNTTRNIRIKFNYEID